MTMQLAINNCTGRDVGELGVSAENFGVKFNEALIHQVIVAYQAGGRSGTRMQKNRAAVAGGSAKPWRQKGTGRARAGTVSSPIFRGGGRTFPSATKDFSQKVNRKMYRAAMRSILSELNRQDRLIIIDELVMDSPKTKLLQETLARLGAPEALLILTEKNQNVELSARNLKSVFVCINNKINPVSLISYEKIVITAEAAKKLDKALQ